MQSVVVVVNVFILVRQLLRPATEAAKNKIAICLKPVLLHRLQSIIYIVIMIFQDFLHFELFYK